MTSTTEIYTLSLHDALPIFKRHQFSVRHNEAALEIHCGGKSVGRQLLRQQPDGQIRSEEHTSELQSQSNIVCRLLLEKKKKIIRKQQRYNIRHNLVSYKR